MFCKVQLIGYVAKECEIKGKAQNVGVFSVAYTGSRRSLTTDEYESIFLNCNVFKDNIQRALDMLHKGDLVYCEGSLDIQSYEDRDGVKKQSTSLNVGMFRILKAKKGVQDTRKKTASKPSNKQAEYEFDDDDNEIPF